MVLLFNMSSRIRNLPLGHTKLMGLWKNQNYIFQRVLLSLQYCWHFKRLKSNLIAVSSATTTALVANADEVPQYIEWVFLIVPVLLLETREYLNTFYTCCQKWTIHPFCNLNLLLLSANFKHRISIFWGSNGWKIKHCEAQAKSMMPVKSLDIWADP